MGGFRWSPAIGDPTIVGWLTVVAYFAAAWLCLRAMMSEKSGPSRPYVPTVFALLRVLHRHGMRPPLPAQRALIWLILAVLMVLLGINKQLDLQTLFTDIGRVSFQWLGIYEVRRAVQLLFILVVFGVALWLGLRLWRLAQGRLRDFRVAFVGCCFVAAYVVIRAASFHHVDSLLHADFLGIQMNWLLELGGIALVGYGALLQVLRARSPSRFGGARSFR